MASGTFEHTFTYEIEFDGAEVIGVGGSSDKALCEWVQKYVREEDGEIQVNTNIGWEADRGCVSGPPDRWEQPYYGDTRTIESVTIGEGKEEVLLPWNKETPKEVREVLEGLVNAEDVEPPADDESDDRDY